MTDRVVVCVCVCVCREDDQIVGSYLVIEDIAIEDYGEYWCQVSNGVDDDDIKLPVHLYRQGIVICNIQCNSRKIDPSSFTAFALFFRRAAIQFGFAEWRVASCTAADGVTADAAILTGGVLREMLLAAHSTLPR